MKEASEVVALIDEGYDKDVEKRARDYIGASIVGSECDASLAFNLRGFPNTEPSAKLKRIFALGHKIEDMVVADLKRRADVRVWEIDGLTGRQYAYVEWGGHVSCHLDGHIQIDSNDEDLMILEVKSMNASNWGKFLKNGVKSSHPKYFAQMQMMMAMSGIQRAFFIAYNKNTSEYHAEIVEADDLEQNFIAQRIERILMDGTGEKVAVDPEDWRCRGCFKREACWEDRVPERHCRTCQHSLPVETGWWTCTRHSRSCPADACADYEIFKPKERT